LGRAGANAGLAVGLIILEFPYINEITIKHMTTEQGTSEFLFDVLTPLGFRVHVTRSYWELIITVKHPVMAGHENEVRKTLENPDEIRQSRSDKNVYLFYSSEQIGRWVCAVARQLNSEGFLITAYPTDSIKEGELVWPR